MNERQEEIVWGEGYRRGKAEGIEEGYELGRQEVLEDIAYHFKMHRDGTLVVTVFDATKVSRVLVQDDRHNGDLYYADTEIVRCKECRHYISDGGAVMLCEVTNNVTRPEDFCSWAERSE